jgi:hypothetical protein
MVINVLEEPTASIFRVEDEHSIFLQKVAS